MVPQVIESFQGYHVAPKKRALYGASVLCSLGVTWVLVKVVPKAAFYLKYEPCSPADACCVHAKVSRVKPISTRLFSICNKAMRHATGLT